MSTILLCLLLLVSLFINLLLWLKLQQADEQVELWRAVARDATDAMSGYRGKYEALQIMYIARTQECLRAGLGVIGRREN